MSYNLIKQLPSCSVEKRLLLELEGYVLKKMAELAPPFDSVASALHQSFTVIDKLGLESLKNVEEYQRSFFPDDTQRISIEGRSIGKSSLSIEIKFTPYKPGTTLSVRFDGNAAREVTTGIAAEIISIIESYKTPNHWFHYLGGVLLWLVLYVALTAGLLTFTSLSFSRMDAFTSAVLSMMIAAGAMFVTFAFVERFRPYSTFETRRNERRKKQFSWVLLGFLGFVLFTVIGVFVRIKLLGF